MTDYPKISIITPSFNQSAFIEETILSVLSQDYPHLEYIVVDGGSSDATLDILRTYQDQLIWISESDQGQANAINKGFKMASGDVLAYLNSDDLYLPGTLNKVGAFFADNPNADWLSGYCQNVDGNGHPIRPFISKYKNFWLRTRSYQVLKVLNYISQPATFWRGTLIQKLGYLDEDLQYTMDYEYWLRIGKTHKLSVLEEELAVFRLHSSSKSGINSDQQFDEELEVAKNYSKGLPIILHYLHIKLRALLVFIYRYFHRAGRKPGKIKTD